MKRILLIFLVFLTFFSCANRYYDSAGNIVPKETMDSLQTMSVRSHLNEQRYRIFMDRMYPMRGPSIFLNDDWGIEVSGDSIGLFLPYVGRVYQIPYGQRWGLHFLEPLSSYKEEFIKYGRRIYMTTRSDFDSYQLVLEVYDNATASLVVTSTNKESIRFTGVMDINDKFIPRKAN